MKRVRRRASFVPIIAVAILASGVLPAAALSPIKVEGGPGNQYGASSNGTFLTWTSCLNDHCNLYVKRLPDGPRHRVNPKGTGAENGYFIGSSTLLVYNQWSDRYRSDIFFYDVATKERRRAPLAVSGPTTWEWAPAASEDYIAFMRVKRSSSGALLDKRLLLFDRHTGTLRTLDQGTNREYGPNFVGSEYVVWWSCVQDYSVCKLLYWSRATGKQVQPSPAGYIQSPGALDEATGDLYFARMRAGVCGRRVTIRRGALGATVSTVVASLPKGLDFSPGFSLATNGDTGDLDLYFSGYHCAIDSSDIYALRGVNTVGG